MIKLIAADMDGTLLNAKRQIDERTFRAIEKARSCGVRFVIVTGRIYSDTKIFLDSVKLKCECLTMNGAAYFDEAGECKFGLYIPKKTVLEIWKILQRHPQFNVELYTDQGHFSTGGRRETLKGMLRRMASRSPQLSRFRQLLMAAHDAHYRNMQYTGEDVEAFIESGPQVAKFITFGNKPEEMAALREELKVIDNLAISASFFNNIEINDAKATKGAALRKYIASIGLKTSEVMVLGDGDNDLSMFRDFPENSVAMGNAIDEVKEIASFVTADNDHAGVALAIERALNLR